MVCIKGAIFILNCNDEHTACLYQLSHSLSLTQSLKPAIQTLNCSSQIKDLPQRTATGISPLLVSATNNAFQKVQGSVILSLRKTMQELQDL